MSPQAVPPRVPAPRHPGGPASGPARIARPAGALARKLLQRHGFVVPRPVFGRAGETFALAAVRTGGSGRLPGPPVLVVPGGPGLGSVLPYAAFRARAARRGLDLIMAEHRGVGLSRRDGAGRDLPPGAVTLEAAADDLAAVLDRCAVERAVVYGSSYGSHLAQVLAVRHPHRVTALILDSPMLSVEDDLALTREHRRRLFWDGADPELAPVAEAVRELAGTGIPMGELSHVVEVVYEFAGPQVLLRLLTGRRAGRMRRLWNHANQFGEERLTGNGAPYWFEPDLVAGIAYGQLGFGLPPDAGPLDPKLQSAPVEGRPVYRGQPYDLADHLSRFPHPVIVVSGERDLRTPRPVADRALALAPEGVLVPLRTTGHSALDSHQIAAAEIAAAVVTDTADRLPARAAALSALPRRGPSHWVGPGLRTATAAVELAGLRP